jgi:hypothetical protein
MDHPGTMPFSWAFPSQHHLLVIGGGGRLSQCNRGRAFERRNNSRPRVRNSPPLGGQKWPVANAWTPAKIASI